MHHVLDQPVRVTDLCDHERCVLWLDTKHDADLELHCKTVLRNYFERVECVRDLAGRPFNGLVRGRNNDRGNGKRVDVVATGSDDGFLDTAKTFRHDVGLMRTVIESLIGRVAACELGLYVIEDL